MGKLLLQTRVACPYFSYYRSNTILLFSLFELIIHIAELAQKHNGHELSIDLSSLPIDK